MSGKLFVSVLLSIILFGFMFVKWVKSSFKSDIEKDAKNFFGAKEDLSGNLIIVLQGYTVLLDYDLVYDTRGMSEYIIANVRLPKLNDTQLKACEKITDIKESESKFYAIIYASWGFRGEKFRSRLEQKLTQLTYCQTGRLSDINILL